ncbi:MAG: rod shape-determining protein RodA [Bdellovibrionaceae bacterium]|nr:rod shape-determining protein RodA [Pseudobdellovibrionaceae bacterium]
MVSDPSKSLFRRINIYLIGSLIALNLIGLVNLLSATTNIARHLRGVFNDQMIWISLGWLLIFFITAIGYRVFIRLAYVIYALNILALIAVMVIGKSSYGAQRWIDLGFFNYQPSETMKLAMILVMARYLSRFDPRIGMDFKDLLIPGLLIGLPFALTAKQPDLGTALLILMVTGLMLLTMKIRFRVLLSALCLALIAGPVVWKVGLKPYQKNRVLTFLYPNRDPRGAGYNSIQAKIAVGSGQIFGKGFRNGSQSQLEFLPEKQTDFIFCVLSEEYGFLGCIATLGIYAILLLSIIQTMIMARDMEAALMCVGIFALILWHVFINTGMVTGLLPIVGVPLPLISYGGTSTLTIMAGLGWVSSIYFRKDMFG